MSACRRILPAASPSEMRICQPMLACRQCGKPPFSGPHRTHSLMQRSAWSEPLLVQTGACAIPAGSQLLPNRPRGGGLETFGRVTLEAATTRQPIEPTGTGYVQF